jgi:glycerol-3-phosphate O-acyltransferase
MSTTEQFNQENLEQDAKLLGQKFSLMVTALFPNSQDQDFFFNLIKKLTPQQIIDLVNILEQQYLAFQTRGLDEQLTKDLSGIIEQYKNKQQAIDQQALDQLAAIEKELGV